MPINVTSIAAEVALVEKLLNLNTSASVLFHPDKRDHGEGWVDFDSVVLFRKETTSNERLHLVFELPLERLFGNGGRDDVKVVSVIGTRMPL